MKNVKTWKSKIVKIVKIENRKNLENHENHENRKSSKSWKSLKSSKSKIVKIVKIENRQNKIKSKIMKNRIKSKIVKIELNWNSCKFNTRECVLKLNNSFFYKQLYNYWYTLKTLSPTFRDFFTFHLKYFGLTKWVWACWNNI